MKKLIAALIAFVGLGTAACGCIARGARIRVPGGTRRIEELQVGDEVICVDPATGRHIETRVTNVRRVRRECVALAFDGNALVCTSDHPLYCPTDVTWSPAGDWATGKRSALAISDGVRLEDRQVRARKLEAGVHEVFDLSVEHPLHNFVANDVLVHNKSMGYRPMCGDPCPCGINVAGTFTCTTPDGGSTSPTCDCT